MGRIYKSSFVDVFEYNSNSSQTSDCSPLKYTKKNIFKTEKIKNCTIEIFSILNIKKSINIERPCIWQTHTDKRSNIICMYKANVCLKNEAHKKFDIANPIKDYRWTLQRQSGRYAGSHISCFRAPTPPAHLWYYLKFKRLYFA